MAESKLKELSMEFFEVNTAYFEEIKRLQQA